MRRLPAARLVAATAFLLHAPRAFAHIDLLEPEARAHGTAARGDTDVDDNSNLKNGPCGQVVTGRTDRVATYAAGETITVRVREENAHVSYIRVSIDLDGEDFPLRAQAPPGPETQEVAAAEEAALGSDGLLAVVREGNDVPGFVHEIDVTLPEQTCTSCTLQVLQFMYDDPAAPFYFQCADLVITAAGEQRDAGALAPDGGSALAGAGDSPASPSAEPRSVTLDDDGALSGPVSDSSAPVGSLPGDDGDGPLPPAASGTGATGGPDGSGCGGSSRERGSVPAFCLAMLTLGLGFRARRRAGRRAPRAEMARVIVLTSDGVATPLRTLARGAS